SSRSPRTRSSAGSRACPRSPSGTRCSGATTAWKTPPLANSQIWPAGPAGSGAGAGSLPRAMRMRQSIAELEQAFVEQAELERLRADRVTQATAARARQRHKRRAQARQSLRFFLLAMTLLLTAVTV